MLRELNPVFMTLTSYDLTCFIISHLESVTCLDEYTVFMFYIMQDARIKVKIVSPTRK